MKKYTAYKTVQLVLFLLLALVIILKIIPDSGVYHQVASDPAMKLLAAGCWIALGLSFLFIYLDFTFFFGYRKEYREMEYAAHSDPMSGIANRFSCDMLVEKYYDQPLPDHIGIIMLELNNIQEINRLYGHAQGNEVIRDFSNILRLSSDELCFVGRNGGNKFMAIFEESTPDDMQKFLERVDQRVKQHNRDVTNSEVRYICGQAFSGEEKLDDITKLIALANSRIGQL